MLIHIPNVLDAATTGEMDTATGSLGFEPGSGTAGWHAQIVKNNQQVTPSPALSQLQKRIVEALQANPVFLALAIPARIAPPLLSRYVAGEHYGTHVDDAIMGRDHPLRTDLSVTLFLNDPETYDGGELILETLAGEDSGKFSPGDAVIYPSTFLHRVTPVTRGERRVAVTWVQSRVRDASQREILFDLDRARRQVFERDGKCATFDLIAKTYANLLRQWAEV